MIVLDTNIISEYYRINANSSVLNWLRNQSRQVLTTCAPVIAELAFGAHRIQIRDGSSLYILTIDKILQEIGKERIFTFDLESAQIYGKIKASRDALGDNRTQSDLMIAAICIANGATLATRNTKDFEGLDVKLINPFEAG